MICAYGFCTKEASFFSLDGSFCPEHTPAAIGYGVGDLPPTKAEVVEVAAELRAIRDPNALTPEEQRQALLEAAQLMDRVVWLLDKACHGTERPAGRLSCLAIVEHTNAKRLYHALKNGAR